MKSRNAQRMLLVLAAVVALGLLGRCSRSTPKGSSSAGTAFAFHYDEDPASATILTIEDSQGPSNLSVTGSKDTNGQVIAISQITGHAGADIAFSALFVSDDSFDLTVADETLHVRPVGEDTYEITIESSTPAPLNSIAPADSGNEPSYTSLRYDDSVLQILRGFRNCVHDPGCSKARLTDLRLISSLALIQDFANWRFDEHCLAGSTLSGQTCFEILGLVNFLTDVIQTMLAEAEDLPDDIRNLCFDPSGQCDPAPAPDDANQNSNQNNNVNANDNVNANTNDNNSEAETDCTQLLQESDAILAELNDGSLSAIETNELQCDYYDLQLPRIEGLCPPYDMLTSDGTTVQDLINEFQQEKIWHGCP